VAVFRDELRDLLPRDEAATRLSRQVLLLSEFLEQKAPEFRVPALERRAMVHAHCHHTAIMTFDAERAVLKRMGLEADVLDSGCCGMAGSFGFERDHYEVAMKVGERVLLPAVRAAARDTLVVADGFSCREQIAQATDRRALHLADLLQMAMREGPHGPAGDYPERKYVPNYARRVSPVASAITVAAGVLLVGAVLWRVAHTGLRAKG
jgi:Fe-S oxidoreductase